MVPNEPAHPARSYAVVADAGPLLHLDDIALLTAIPERSTLHVRPALLREVIDHVRQSWNLP